MLWSWIGDLTMYRWPYTLCGWCVPSVCRELEQIVWFMWRPCKVDVRCHPDVRGLNEALCSAYCGEIRCRCAVPYLEWYRVGQNILHNFSRAF